MTRGRGIVTGKLTFTSIGRMKASEILKFHPEIQLILDEIVKKGWKYLYIETRGKAIAEHNLEESIYRLMQSQSPGIMTTGYYFEVHLGKDPPEINGVPEILEFRINISTEHFPRAATIDLSKNIITYLHDAFWRWEKDPKKLTEALEVYQVAKWLIEEKKLKLHEKLDITQYNELKSQLENKV
jgi:hypothetical protein